MHLYNYLQTQATVSVKHVIQPEPAKDWERAFRFELTWKTQWRKVNLEELCFKSMC